MIGAMVAIEAHGALKAKRELKRHLTALNADLRAVCDAYGMRIIEGEQASSVLTLRWWPPNPKYAIGVRGVVRGFDTWVVEYRTPLRSRFGTIETWMYDVHAGRRLALRAPAPLAIKPQNDLLVGTEMLLGDITTESIEFNDAFVLTCEDRRFANQVIHPLMMTWLLDRCRDLRFEIWADTLLLQPPRDALEPGWTARWLGALVEFADQIPAFVRDDYPPTEHR